MKIRYGCFFSYAHGQHAFMSKFKNDLVEALQCYLEPHFDTEKELFVDSEQLKRVLSVLLPALLYVLAVQFLGLYVASAIYISLFMIIRHDQ